MALRSKIRALTVGQTKIITPRYRLWMRSHSDDPCPQWVVDLLAAELTKVQRVRTGSFSGSSAGSCLRAQEFGFLGVQPDVDALPDVDLINIFNDGRWRHLRHQANMLSAGILSRIEVSLDWPNKRSKGSMDGVGIVPDDHPNVKWRGEEFGFELKGMNGWQFQKVVKEPLPIEKHVCQVDRYFLASGLKLFVVLYEDKLTNRFHEWVMERDEARIAEQQEELDALNEAVDRQEVHPQMKSCSKRMGPYWESCAYAGKGGICESWRDWGATRKRLERRL